jgi:outer membrane protein TolC
MKTHSRQLFFLAAVIFFGCGALAQNTDSLGRNANRLRVRTDSVVDIRDRLVQLAMAGPIFEIASREVDVAHHQLGKAKTLVLNQLTVSGNLNEYSIRGRQDNVGNLFPRYNIGLQLPLGLFFTRSHDVNAARQNLAITEAERQKLYNELKAEILRLYEDYLMYSALLTLQTKTASENYVRYMQLQADFEAGEATEADYNEALRKYTEEQTRKLNTQRNKEATRIEIEKYINVPLEDILKGLK